MPPEYGQAFTPSLGADDHIQGSTNASIALTEYCDYQCPQCGQAHLIVQELQHQLGEQFCFVFRHFPSTQHPQAQRAAEAAEAASAQGKFWLMHDTLFAHQQALEDADLVEYADSIHLDMPRFLRALATRVYVDRIQMDVESGHRCGVEETPTSFISVRHKGTQNLKALMMALLQVGNGQST
jgi:protein-disulfide isomerase